MKPPETKFFRPDEIKGFIPVRNSLKTLIKDTLLAFTMAIWFFVRAWSHLLSDRDRYFNKIPAGPQAFGALLFNILAVGVVVWFGIGVWRRARSWFLQLFLGFVFLSMLIFPADYFRVQMGGLAVGGIPTFVRNPKVIAGFLVLLGLFVWKHRKVTRVIAILVCFTLPAAAWTMIKIVLLALNLMQLQQCAHVPPLPPLHAPKAGPRVIWIIFDETDYRIAFEKRPPDCSLPAFDRLRQEAINSDHALPPGDSTIISLPALLTGKMLKDVNHDDCDLALTLADNNKVEDWSAMPSVFSRAHELGFNTALIGWYHPYPRILGQALNYCSWYPLPGFELARADTFFGSIEQQWRALAGHIEVRRRFIKTCQESLGESLRVVGDPVYGLVFLHLPPPHQPGIYDAAKDEFTVMGIEQPAGYFANLMLADHEFGAIRQKMEDAEEWDKTWVIISADHSYRNSQTYDGIRDFRVPFIVKAPGENNKPMNVSHEFNTVLTQELVLSILRGEITNQTAAAAFLKAGKAYQPVARTGEGTE